MTTNSVSAPFPIFTDTDGDPLDLGYVYIGQPNLDAQSSPKSAYWDAALTIPAAQPIRTRGGYPVNNGTPARIYVDGDYSIKVNNRNGTLIYSSPAATDRMDSAFVGYDGGTVQDVLDAVTGPSGSDQVGFDWAVLPSAIKKANWGIQTAATGVNILRYIPPAEWPAIIARTSTYDATVDIQAALNSGHKDLWLPHGRFKVTPQADSRALSIPDGVNLRGDPSASELYMVTDAADSPNTSVWWDVVLFTGERTEWSSIDGIRIRHSGGARSNTCSIAVRNGATKVSITRNNIDGAIASAIGVEGSVPSPYNTSCIVMGNVIGNSVRHGVYISGATHNTVKYNRITTTRLEAIVNRNGNDNDIDENIIDGDGINYPPHAIAMAQPAIGIYKISRMRVRGNRMNNIPGAGFYGQGIGVTLEDCDITDNIINAMQSPASTSHGMMIYRASDCRIKDNTVHGGRNRGIMFYGCRNNNVTGNKIRNVNSASSAVGAMMFADYTDPADSTTTYSTGNFIDDNKVIDDRATKLHVYGIQFLAGSNQNKIGSNTVSGTTSSKYIAADSWSTFKFPAGEERQWYYNDLPGGNTASTQIPVIGDTFSDVVTESGWLKGLFLITRQTITSGTITATLYKNGSAFQSVTLTGDGADISASIFYMPEQHQVLPEDRLTVFVSATSVVTGSTVDILVRAKFAAS